MTAQNPFIPFPELHTDRLILRRLTADDAPDVFVMRSDPEVMRFIPRPLATSVEDALAVINMVNGFVDSGERINWGMELRETGRIVGMIGYVNRQPEHFRAEIGYSLARAYHRQGLMREALLRTIQYGFEALQLHTIEAIIDAENEASGALLKAVGFRQEAFFREDFYYNGQFRNSIHFGLLQTDLRPAG